VVTVDRSAWQATLALISIGLLVGGCGRVGASPSRSADAATTPSAVSSVGPSAPVQPSAGPAGEPSPAEPPAASIADDGGDRVAGQLGSYTWLDAGSDAPWLDGSPIRIGAGERLTLTFADSIGVANWTASRVVPGARNGIGSIGMADGEGGPVAFDSPPRGSWSVNVTVWFSDDRGSAAYYWLVDVD
jgi:hypothetical protein